MNIILTALLLSFFAGLSTTLGSIIAFFVKKPSKSFLSFILGFSAGVMIMVSFVELLDKAIENIGLIFASIAFFVGIILIYFLDISIPHAYKSEKAEIKSKKLFRLGILVAIGIALHNFPEGFAVLAGSLSSIKTGILLAIAIAIHNIPEGISVSVPIYYATKSKRQAFLFSFLSGIFEPIGAIIGILILLPFLNELLISLSLAFVAGVMVYISFDELLPAAHQYGREHTAGLGVILGMLVMVVSLVLVG